MLSAIIPALMQVEVIGKQLGKAAYTALAFGPTCREWQQALHQLVNAEKACSGALKSA